MRRHIAIVALALVLCPTLRVRAAHVAASHLPRSAPEAQGVSSEGVLAFIEGADRLDVMNSFMLLRHGRVIVEAWWAPYESENGRDLYSLSKSFICAAVGLATAEGKLSIEDPALKFFPDDAPREPSLNLKAMRVRDLLCMSTGQDGGVSVEPDKASAKLFLANPVTHAPGTLFQYNNSAAFMLSAIIQKQTGQSALEYLRPRLFEPLGIAQPVWGTNFQGISLGAYGLTGRTEDIAKFGQLYLQRGNWKGKQLVPAKWADDATSRQISNGSNATNDFEQGYGYLFWRGRHGTFFGAGWSGQICLVLPEQDAVIAITGGLKDMQAVLNLVWDKLLPAFQPRALPREPATCKALKAKLASLSLPTPEGTATSPPFGKIGCRFVFPTNDQNLESISLIKEASGARLTLLTRSIGVENRLRLGFGKWIKGRGAFTSLVGSFGKTNQLLAASAAWTNDDTLIVKVCACETPFYMTFKLHFEGDRLTRDWWPNVGFGDSKQTQLIGRAE